MNRIKILTVLCALLCMSSSYSVAETTVDRRSFLSLVGLGGASAAALATSGSSSLGVLFNTAQQPAVDLEYFLSLRREYFTNLRRVRLLRNRLLAIGTVEPQLTVARAHPDLVKYYRGLVRAIDQEGVSERAVSSLEEFRIEFRTHYPQIASEIDREHTPYEEIEFLAELLGLRSSLGVELLNRMSWQRAYPEEDILIKNSNSAEIGLLISYRDYIEAYAEVFENATWQLPAQTESLFREWFQGSRILFGLPVVRNELQQPAGTSNFGLLSCSRFLK